MRAPFSQPTGLRTFFWLWLAQTVLGLGSSLAIWQSKVEPDLQGRVLAVRPLISSTLTPPALVLSGVLADRVFEPDMQDELGRTLETLPDRGDRSASTRLNASRAYQPSWGR